MVQVRPHNATIHRQDSGSAFLLLFLHPWTGSPVPLPSMLVLLCCLSEVQGPASRVLQALRGQGLFSHSHAHSTPAFLVTAGIQQVGVGPHPHTHTTSCLTTGKGMSPVLSPSGNYSPGLLPPGPALLYCQLRCRTYSTQCCHW